MKRAVVRLLQSSLSISRLLRFAKISTMETVISAVLEKIATAAVQGFTQRNDELEHITAAFRAIQDVLKDAEDRVIVDRSVRLWLSRLRQVAYDMDDLLDRRQKSAVDKTDGGGSRDDDDRKKVCACLSSPYACFERTVSNLKDAREMKEIRERLDQIAGERNRFNFSNSRGDEMLVGRGDRSWTTFLRRESEMVGMEDEKREIISRLLSGSGDDYGNVDVFAIVGLAGMGKTTLAREIYHDISVRDHFDFFSWVCVSEIFDLVSVTKAIIRYHLPRGTTPADLGLDSLQAELGEMLRGKKFLLILDDVWNEDREKWALLRQPLKSAAPGSKILVTARAKLVANVMNPVYIHELNGLSDDQAWRLFSLMAFHGWSLEDISELETVGREIVKKCKGVPLSIKVMAHEMNFRRTVADWHSVLDSGMMSSPRVADKNLPPFLRSYYNLPPHLKQCFIYCSLFPKGAVLVKAKLVKLWIAQDFIRREGNREIEHIGTEYFDDLVERSMIQEVGIYGKENRFQMHDLLHDLAEFIAEGDTYIFMSGKSEHFPVNVRHASVFFIADNTSIRIDSHSARKLRTLFVHRIDKIGTALASLLHQAKYLRVLQFNHSAITTLPRIIAEMEYLRYLDLSNSKIVELPESLSHLRYLQTLDLTCCRQLKKLPRGMGRMVGLRYLEIDSTDSLECLPEGLGRLRSLRTLCKFIVGGGGGGCEIGGLQQLNSLQGNLQIQHLERVSSPEEAGRAELHNKADLQRLVLEMSGGDEDIAMPGRDGKISRMDSVFEGLRPHPNIMELVIDCPHGSELPNWIAGSTLSNLTKLEIHGFTQCVHFASLGELPALNYLEIKDVGVKMLDSGFYHREVNGEILIRAFPALKELSLSNMSDFKEWAQWSRYDGDYVMPSLLVLRLQHCPKLEGLPDHFSKAPLKCLIIQECERIKRIGSSFPFLEEFTLIKSSKFFSSCLPDLPKLQKFHIEKVRTQKFPNARWGQLMALQSLHVSQCHELKALPDGLEQLESLKQLTVEHCNKLESLPDGLGQLQSLEQLTIEYCNKLKSIPAGLGQLRAVRALKINHLGALTCLPDGLVQLMAVKSLKINNFESLTCLPNGLGQLHSLEELIIEDCHNLERLVDELVQLEALKSLEINGLDALIYLPNGLGQLQSLKELRIEGCNKLESLPESMGQLQSLEELMIKDCNKLKSIPDALGQLKALKSLTIAGLNALTSLPDGLGELIALKTFIIHHLHALTRLPDGLGQLQSLETLRISSCQKVESLPNGLGQLRKLKLLDISRLEAVTGLPDALEQLESLETLRICYWEKLESLPPWLEQLRGLKELIIYGCKRLKSLPQGLQGLSQIKDCPLLL